MTDTVMETAPQALARKIASEDLATVLLARADAEGVNLVGPGGPVRTARRPTPPAAPAPSVHPLSPSSS